MKNCLSQSPRIKIFNAAMSLMFAAFLLTLLPPFIQEVGAAVQQRAISEDGYFADLDFLTSFPHRLPGSEAAGKTADYIEQRLKDAGITEIIRYPMALPYLKVERCEMTIEGKTVEMAPLRPNLTIPPSTPPEGIAGKLLYVGEGEMEDYGERSAEDAIVVMDYESSENWRFAFQVGAKAIIFLGEGDETPAGPLHSAMPANLLRFYAERDDFSDQDLKSGDVMVTLHSQVTWDYRQADNIVARVPGTDSAAANNEDGLEAVVMSAAYDSFGTVPHRAPGARRAANVAALLGLAAEFNQEPASRDMVFMFSGGRSYNHQGMREVYEALLMEPETHERLKLEHKAETQTLRQADDLLRKDGLKFDRRAEGGSVLRNFIRNQAQYARDDVAFDLQLFRMRNLDDRDEAFTERESKMENSRLQWDQIRRAIDTGELKQLTERIRAYSQGEFEIEESRTWNQDRRRQAREEAGELEKLFAELRDLTETHIQSRLKELEKLMAQGAQRSALRKNILRGGEEENKKGDIVLHLTLDLTDSSSNWAVIAGHQEARLYNVSAAGDSDNPGYYGPVLGAFRGAAETIGETHGLLKQSLEDPYAGKTLYPGIMLPEGLVAGAHGIYNLTLATAFGGRLRDGQPADTRDNLDAELILNQARHLFPLVHAVSGEQALSRPPAFSAHTQSDYPGWRRGRSWGDSANMQVTGGLAETRPASGTLMALWPGVVNWRNLEQADQIADFVPFSLERVDANGHFRILGARRDLSNSYMMLGSKFDNQGRINAITSRESIQSNLAETARSNLFPSSENGVIVSQAIHRALEGEMRFLIGNDIPFRGSEALWGGNDQLSFFYLSVKNFGRKVKFFRPLGPAVLGDVTNENPTGKGVDPELLRYPVNTDDFTYQNLWDINENRLSIMRSHGVTRADLEVLHNTAQSISLQVANEQELAKQQALRKKSASLSQRIYGPVISSLHDLVHALVILLLLCIPFAFAMERLLVCAASIYGRIAGFVIMFLLTFGLLYWLHPGFAVSATPMVIFLAFSILVLSSLVIYILIRKFNNELKALQGQSLKLHDVEVSRGGAVLAAVGMGMSTMRRRPTRTFLTAVTVVILTFTILCFASFTREIGVRTAYEGPITEDMPPSILIRNADYSELQPGIPEMLRGDAEENTLISVQQWLIRKETEDPRFMAANPHTGDSVALDAAMGITPAETQRWPALADCLSGNDTDEKAEALRKNKVYLPSLVIDNLALEPGDSFLLHGHPVVLAGSINSARLQVLRNVDRQPVTPVNFADAAEREENDQQDQEEAGLVADHTLRTFTRLSPDQIAVGSARLVKRLGGEPHIVNVYPPEDINISDKGQELARTFSTPVWVSGIEGVERMFLTRLHQFGGGFAIAIPLLLGGFIIFGTLLGSISDREREIYTFSALGLAPSHVGLLFFAEAAVYAVVGGMGGQIMAQITARIASSLAEKGIIRPVALNFSSTNSMFALAVVMLVVLISAVYPAIRASRSANPGLARSWKMPPPQGDELNMRFPFTVSAYDITGVVSFLREHFQAHNDVGLGKFAASDVAVKRNEEGNLELTARLALAPFDLGVTQDFTLTATPSDIEGVDEVMIRTQRLSGAPGDWIRCNRVFIRDLRVQFLAWRTLADEVVEEYRMATLEILGEKNT